MDCTAGSPFRFALGPLCTMSTPTNRPLVLRFGLTITILPSWYRKPVVVRFYQSVSPSGSDTPVRTVKIDPSVAKPRRANCCNRVFVFIVSIDSANPEAVNSDPFPFDWSSSAWRWLHAPVPVWVIKRIWVSHTWHFTFLPHIGAAPVIGQ